MQLGEFDITPQLLQFFNFKVGKYSTNILPPSPDQTLICWHHGKSE